jgi:hypothetical protein
VERNDLFSDKDRDNSPAIVNRRYPLRDRKPKVIQFMNLMDFYEQPFEPWPFLKVIGCREAHLCQPSVQEEFDSHNQNERPPVPLPPGWTVIGTRWVFKVKPWYLDNPARYKSRFVAKKYFHVEGIDFNEYATYAKVVGYCSLRGLSY